MNLNPMSILPAVFPVFGAGNASLLGGGAGGGLFGPSTQKSTAEKSPLEQAFTARMMTREGQTYPELMRLMGFDNGGKTAVKNSSDIYDASVAELEKNYPDLAKALFDAQMSPVGETAGIRKNLGDVYRASDQQLSDLSLPPEAQRQLDTIRQSRIGTLTQEAQDLVGSRFADLARRGVISSSTGEGGMSSIMRDISPALAQIEQDYAQQRLALPQQLAQARFGMGSNYATQDFNTMNAAADRSAAAYKDKFNMMDYMGNKKAGALQTKWQNQYAPLMDIWKSTAGIASQPMSSTTTQTNQQSPFATLMQAGGAALPFLLMA